MYPLLYQYVTSLQNVLPRFTAKTDKISHYTLDNVWLVDWKVIYVHNAYWNVWYSIFPVGNELMHKNKDKNNVQAGC